MQIDRMFKLIYILLDRKHVTAKSLAEKLEVSTRTIYRDLDKLSMAGVPIYTNKGKDGGIGLLESFVMDRSLLSNEEQNKLLMGLDVLRATEYDDVDDAIIKLRKLFNRDVNNWIEVDFSNWGSSKAEKNKFEDLKFALTNCRTICFDYYDFSGEKTHREVNPIKLAFKHRAWYLKGYCRKKEDMRSFKVHRIKCLEVLSESFNRDDYFQHIEDLEYNDINDSINLGFILSRRVKHRVYDEFDEEDFEKRADGSFKVEIKLPEDEWLYNYIISFGEDIEIIEPEYLKDIIRDKLIAILQNYS